jgi:hypothetical protein
MAAATESLWGPTSSLLRMHPMNMHNAPSDADLIGRLVERSEITGFKGIIIATETVAIHTDPLQQLQLFGTMEERTFCKIYWFKHPYLEPHLGGEVLSALHICSINGTNHGSD